MSTKNQKTEASGNRRDMEVLAEVVATATAAAVAKALADRPDYARGRDLAIIGKDGKTVGGVGESEMTTTRSRSNGRVHSSKSRKYVSTLRSRSPRGKSGRGNHPAPLSRREPPSGDGFAARIARGLAKYREQTLKMSVPQTAAAKDIDQHLLYRLESGALPQTTGQHIDEVLRKLGLDIIDCLKLGAA